MVCSAVTFVDGMYGIYNTENLLGLDFYIEHVYKSRKGYIQLSQCCFVLEWSLRRIHISSLIKVWFPMWPDPCCWGQIWCKCDIRKLYKVFMSYNPNPFWDLYYCRFFLSLCWNLHPSNCSIIGVNNMNKLKCKLPIVHTMYHHVIIFMSVIVALGIKKNKTRFYNISSFVVLSLILMASTLVRGSRFRQSLTIPECYFCEDTK